MCFLLLGRTKPMHRSISTFIAAGLLFTAASIGVAATAAPSPKPAAPIQAPALTMNLEQAKQLVARIEASKAKPGDESLMNPKSLDDVLEILRRDQINLFPRGVAFAATQSGPEALAHLGQIELAWGEALFLMAELNSNIYQRLSFAARRLEMKKASGGLTPDEQRELTAMSDEAQNAVTTATALNLVAGEHISAGATKARELIATYPDNYLGYRVVADYYRMRLDWENFGKTVEKLQKINPNSNGLLFLLGAAAYQRDHDKARAAHYFEQALKNDPKFTRAQAHLLMIQGTIDKTYAELQNLAKINPEHQIVGWTGLGIRQAYAQWKIEQDSQQLAPPPKIGVQVTP
jgi:tetratricopeptide (TPR) repeat protein